MCSQSSQQQGTRPLSLAFAWERLQGKLPINPLRAPIGSLLGLKLDGSRDKTSGSCQSIKPWPCGADSIDSSYCMASRMVASDSTRLHKLACGLLGVLEGNGVQSCLFVHSVSYLFYSGPSKSLSSPAAGK